MDSIQKPIRPKPGKTQFWKGRIQSELETPANLPVQDGPWDPYNHFKKPEQITHFFSGHKIREKRRKDRMTHASWAIEQVLQSYPPGICEAPATSGDIESMAATMAAMDPKKILRAIRVDAQRDIDADDHTPHDRACEVIHAVDSAAQTLVAASPNSLGPPIVPCVKYLRMEKCGDYGPDKLNMWRSPLFPRIDGQEGRKQGFLDNQVTSIVWILSRFLGNLPSLKVTDPETDELIPPHKDEVKIRNKLRAPRYFGAILADSMGLGKTLSCIACLELMAGHKLNVVRGDGRGSRQLHRPMAVLAPNATVAAQWVEEICLSTDPENITKIITSGNGLQFRRHPSGRVRALNTEEFSGEWPDDVRYVWNERDKRASKTIIIMSIDTFSNRTVGVSRGPLGQVGYTSTFTELGRKFSIVIVDEAHKVKNDMTRNWKSIFLLDRQFTLLVTATPAVNSLTDLMGLARLLWPAPSEYLKAHKADTWQRMEEMVKKLQDLKCLEGTAACDDMRLVAGRPGLLAKMLCRNRGATHDIQLVRDYLKYFESLAILRRSPSSSLTVDWGEIDTVSLDGLFPKVDHSTVELELDPKLAKAYQTVHAALLGDYIKTVNGLATTRNSAKKARSIKSITGTYRLLQIASASVGVFRLDSLLSKNGFGTTAGNITIMRRARVTLKCLVQFMLEPYDPNPKTALSVLGLAVRYSPVLRYILHYIKENILDEAERTGGKIKKLLITEASPILAYFYELVLQFLGFNCRTFHADLSQEARRELAADFNSEDEHSCQILIQMYTVGFAGANLHRNCSRVLVVSQASSLPVQWQAVHRVIRVGQMSDVQVTRIKVRNSHHTFRESRQVEKLLPELGARAQGSMNDVLVDILNLFQSEVDAAWKSPEASQLMADMSVLLDEYNETRHARSARAQLNRDASEPNVQTNDGNNEGNGPAGKQRKLNNGSAQPLNNQDDEESEGEHEEQVEVKAEPVTSTAIPPQPEAKSGAAGWVSLNPEEDPNSLAAFLTLRTRSEYYAEFKMLPRVAKSYFSHRKNNLRRVLSFGTVDDGNKTTRVWRVKDLRHPAVLERAVELMLRVRLGTGPIELLPLPQIDFSLTDEEVRKTLQKQLAKVTQTDQDVEAAREQMEGPSKKGVKDTLPDGISIEAPIAQIEEALDQEARHSGITAAQKERIDSQPVSSEGVDVNGDAYEDEADEGEADEDEADEDEMDEDEDGDVEMSDIPVTDQPDAEVKSEEGDEANGGAEDNTPQEPNNSVTVTDKVVIIIDDSDDDGDATGDAARNEPRPEPKIKQEPTEEDPITVNNDSDNVAPEVSETEIQSNPKVKTEPDVDSVVSSHV